MGDPACWLGEFPGFGLEEEDEGHIPPREPASAVTEPEAIGRLSEPKPEPGSSEPPAG